MSKECSHEPLTDTGIGYYHCPACGQGWTYDEWNKQAKQAEESEKLLESIYMELILLVENDCLLCIPFTDTVDKLKSKFEIKRKL